jgi:hypothetical protein
VIASQRLAGATPWPYRRYCLAARLSLSALTRCRVSAGRLRAAAVIMTYSGDRSSAARKRALRRLAREDRPTYRALFEQVRPQVRTHDQASGRALTLLRYQYPDRYLELYAQERLGPGTNVPPEVRAVAWRTASRRLATLRFPAYRDLFGQAKVGGLTGSCAYDLAITQLRNAHQELFVRLLVTEISRWPGRHGLTVESCPGCGGDPGNNWSGRDACPEPCGRVHTRCSACGEVLDDCYWSALRGSADLLTAHAPVIMAAFRDAITSRRPPDHCLACHGAPPCPEHAIDARQAGQYQVVAEQIAQHIKAVTCPEGISPPPADPLAVARSG